MPNNNHKIGFISALLLLGTALLFVGGPDYYASRSFKSVWDLGHVVYFALLAVLLSRWTLIYRMSLVWQWVVILCITLLIGISIELLQYGTTRTPDAGDILRDLTGSLLVLVFGPFGSKLKPSSWQLSLRLTVVLLMLVQLWPLTKSLIDEAVARYQFPLLSGFETPFEIDRWERSASISIETIASVSKGNVMKLSLTTDQYSGAVLKHFDGDWTLVRTLQISLYNPDTNPVEITCRIHDRGHSDGDEEYEDRFNRSYMLTPGWNQIEIDLEEVENSPSSRNMDMSQIRGLGLFVVSLPAPRTLYLDEVRLTY